MKNPFHITARLFSWTLIFQIGFGLPLLSSADPHPSARAARPKLTRDDFARPTINALSMDPVYNAFLHQPALPAPEFKSDDPAIDQDPFFMRSQTWGELSSPDLSEDTSFTKERDGTLTLHLPVLRRSLHIKQGLTPVALTDEYLFLTVDEGSDLFERANGKLLPNETLGEGIFYIRYQELLSSGPFEAPVHVHFFPLPGRGWTGQIQLEEYSDLEALALTSREGDFLPVALPDLRQVEKVQAYNAVMGAYVATKAAETGERVSRAYKTGNLRELGMPMPARGSTYGFGMLFTGMDLDHPENSVFQTSPTKLSWLRSLFMSEAYAAGSISGELAEKLVHFGFAFGALTLIGVTLKYTVLREKFAERRAIMALRQIPALEFDLGISVRLYRQGGFTTVEQLAAADPQAILEATKAGDGTYLLTQGKAADLKLAAAQTLAKLAEERANPQPSKLTRLVLPQRFQGPVARFNRRVVESKAFRAVVESGDAVAAVLTTSNQIPGVVSATVFERMFDRRLPGLAAGSNRLTRKSLEYLLLWNKRISSNTPVSMKTFMLGGVLMGVVDTGTMHIQAAYFYPWMAEQIAPYLPPELADKVYENFNPNNETTKALVVNNLVRNFVIWLTRGASDYAQESQIQLEAVVRNLVDDAIRKMGKNPLAPEVQALRKELFDKTMNAKFKQLGLPDQIYFLFDVNTVDSIVLKYLGYELTAEQREAIKGEAVLASSRPALVASALDATIKDLRRSITEAPTPAKVKALTILSNTREELRLLSAKNSTMPLGELRRQLQSTNAMLSLLTYAGEVDAAVKYVPELWSKVDPDGAREAAVRFRQWYFHFYTGDGTLIQLPEDFVNANIRQAKAEVEKEMAAKPADQQTSESQFALAVEQNLRQKYAEVRRAEEIRNYKPNQRGWYERIQHRRASRVAHERYLRSGVDPSTDKDGATFKRYYAEALANEVAIYPNAVTPEERELLEYVVARSTMEVTQEIESNPALKAYLERVSTTEREDIELRMFANNYLDNYRLATVDQGLVPPRSPMQPGFTQKLRQKDFVRNSKCLTILARIVDSGFSDEVGHRTGLKAKLNRNIPLYYDMVSNTARLGKRLLTKAFADWKWNAVLWGANIPWAANLVQLLAAGPLCMGPMQWLNRALRQQGIQPMGDLISKLAYGIPFPWVTAGMTAVYLMAGKDAIKWVQATQAAVVTSQAATWVAEYGAKALPFVPLLLIIPFAKGAWDRHQTRMAIREGERRTRDSNPMIVFSCESTFY